MEGPLSPSHPDPPPPEDKAWTIEPSLPSAFDLWQAQSTPAYPLQCPPGLRGTQPGSASLACTGANASHACAYFQEDSRDPTPKHVLPSPDGENVYPTLPGLMGAEALPLRQGKETLSESASFSEGEALPSVTRGSQQQQRHH